MDEQRFSIIGCIDINNDNVMEVIVKNEVIGGEKYLVYELKGGRLEGILEYFAGYGQ